MKVELYSRPQPDVYLADVSHGDFFTWGAENEVYVCVEGRFLSLTTFREIEICQAGVDCDGGLRKVRLKAVEVLTHGEPSL